MPSQGSADGAPVLVPLPASVRATALPDDALADLAALRPLDPLEPTAVLSPRAARERVRAALEAAGYALVGDAGIDPGTAVAGLPSSEAARLAKAPLDRWEPSAAARPILRLLDRPRGLGLAAHARRPAGAPPDLADAGERLAPE